MFWLNTKLCRFPILRAVVNSRNDNTNLPNAERPVGCGTTFSRIYLWTNTGSIGLPTVVCQRQPVLLNPGSTIAKLLVCIYETTLVGKPGGTVLAQKYLQRNLYTHTTIRPALGKLMLSFQLLTNTQSIGNRCWPYRHANVGHIVDGRI